MNIDKNTVYKVADLARIAIKEEEVGHLTAEMNKILTFMDQLNSLDTTNVEPLVYLNETSNVWREDVVKNEVSTADALRNAAKHNESYFMVPKIIEK